MKRALIVATSLALVSPAIALGYVPGDTAVPVFGSGNLGTFTPSAETPTNFSMIPAGATPIAQPAQQTGPAASTQTFTGHVTTATNTLTLDSALTGGALPSGTQILAANLGGCGATPTSAAPANCPTVTAGSGTAIGSTYTISGASSESFASGTIHTIPVGLNEDALVVWDSVIHRQFDSGFAFGCLRGKAIWAITNVKFFLDGGTPITATAETANSETGQPAFCWAAPTSLFAGHNGAHYVSAVVTPVVGNPVVMQSNQAVTAAASSALFTVPGLTPANTGTIGAAVAALYQITNSSDQVTFPNASTDNTTNGQTLTTNFHGLYCVSPTGADSFGLVEATFAPRSGVSGKAAPICSIEMSGASPSGGSLTITGQTINPPGGNGQIIVGQTVSGTGITAGTTVASVSGSLPTLTVGLSTPSATEAGPVAYTFAGNIPATASGATFTLTTFHAGGTARGWNQSNGSDFFVVNDPANGSIITEVSAFASLTGSNSNPATAVSPAATIQGAMLAVTPTEGKVQFFSTLSSLNVQGLNTATVGGSTCTTFTKTGNTTGAVPFAIGMPVKYDGQTVSGGVFVMDAVYFIQSAASDVVTLAATPGGACINDTTLVTAATGGSGFANSASILYDYSETTILMQHTGSGTNFFSLGDATGTPAAGVGAIGRFGRYGFMQITWDSATATFDNVAINSVGIGNGSNANGATNGLGLENLEIEAKTVMPTAVVHLTRDIAKGTNLQNAAVISFNASELPAGFPIILSSQADQGTRPTQIIAPSGGGCMPVSGDNGTATGNVPIGQAETVMVTLSQMGTGAAPVQTLTINGSLGHGTNSTAIPPESFTALDECPIGTPITLADYWAFDGVGGTLWLNNAEQSAPTPFLSSTTTASATQIQGVGTNNVIVTNSSVFNLTQGLTGAGYVANSRIYGAASAGTKGSTWTLSNSTIDVSGNTSWLNTNAVSGATSYGIADSAPGANDGEVSQTDTVTGSPAGTVAGAVLTINPAATQTGTLFQGMGLAASACSPAISGVYILSVGPGANQYTLNTAPTATTCTSLSFARSLWHLAPPGNTTAGNYSPLPRAPHNDQVRWECSGVTISGVFTPVGYDYKTAMVIVDGVPTSKCLMAGGSTQFSPIAGFHEDMYTYLATGGTGFNVGVNVDGLLVVNSEGFSGPTFLVAGSGVVQNIYVGNSSSHIFPSLAGSESSYADYIPALTTENALFRNDNFGSVGTTAGAFGVTNGSYIWDGDTCGNAGIVSGFFNSGFPGVVVRNTGWPGQGGLPSGSC